MQPITVSVGPLGNASANNIALTQTPTVGNLALNGSTVVSGVAILDQPREVLITTTGNETTRNFTLFGTDWSGAAISEVVPGSAGNSTAASVLSYATVNQITISGNASNALTVGTNGVASSPWVRFDGWAGPSIAIQVTVAGTGNYTVQQTLDDPNSATNPVSPANVTWVNNSTAALVGGNSTQQGSYAFIPVFARTVLNSGNGTVTTTFQQASVAPY